MAESLDQLGQLQRSINLYRSALLRADGLALSILQASYEPSIAALSARINELVDLYAETGFLGDSERVILKRADDLLRQVETEVTRLATVSKQVIPAAQARMVWQAIDRARALTAAQAATTREASRISSGWNLINRGAVESLVGTMRNGAPLDEWINAFAGDAVQDVRSTLLDGVNRGVNAFELGSMLADVSEFPLRRATTLARTESLRAYRSASIESMQANSDVLDGWEWSAAGDACLACTSKDGSVYPLTTQFMPTHVNCRCAPIPRLKDNDLLPQRTTRGDEYRAKPMDEQLKLIPKSAHDEYRAGELTIDDFVHVDHDPVWGDSVRTASLKQARANARRRREGPAPAAPPVKPKPRKPRAPKAQPAPAPTPATVPEPTPAIAPPTPTAKPTPARITPDAIKDRKTAIAYFDGIGVTVGELKGPVKSWKAVAEIYEQEFANGVPMMPKVNFKGGSKYIAALSTTRSVRGADAGKILNQSLDFYTGSPFFKDPEVYGARLASTNYLAVPTMRGVVTHEMGHWLHDANITNSVFSRDFVVKLTGEVVSPRFKAGSKELEIAQRVSRYGATQPVEFVAEVYAGLRNGVEWDDEVLALYRRYGGPEL